MKLYQPVNETYEDIYFRENFCWKDERDYLTLKEYLNRHWQKLKEIWTPISGGDA